MRFASTVFRSTALKRRVFAVILMFTFVVIAYSQAPKSNLPPPSDPTLRDSNKEESKDDPRFGSPEAEMRSKLEIKDEKKKYDEHVARAKEASQLAAQISTSYQTHNSFLSDDQKRLERLEKLTKRIRNDAGGENSDDQSELKDVPAGMDKTLQKISDMANELEKLVENTPRNVVSAAVIDQANKLLCIIQHIRGSR
ncbi:MAG TPA: hypothetical protein VE863_00050 [Pyrinomonadaceae bacterium]|jgi:vacuolar-type H+-ATPase subunit I/STV1|nr:hypothetical protein [Pyrinomonadaceae bacterium]